MMLVMMMTRGHRSAGHVFCHVSGIAACERTRRRALASAKNQRHDEQCRELIWRPHHLYGDHNMLRVPACDPEMRPPAGSTQNVPL
jgi:hypothetical protein